MKIARNVMLSEENVKWLKGLNASMSDLIDQLVSKERIRLSKTPEEEYIEAWRKLEREAKDKASAESIREQRKLYIEKQIELILKFTKNSGVEMLPKNKARLEALNKELLSFNDDKGTDRPSDK